MSPRSERETFVTVSTTPSKTPPTRRLSPISTPASVMRFPFRLPEIARSSVQPSSAARTYVRCGVIAQHLESLGIVLPPVFPPAGNYLGCVIDDGLVYVGGHGPVAGAEAVRGRVGGD